MLSSDNIPSLPHYSIKNPSKAKLAKAFDVVNGVRIEKSTNVKHELRDGIPHSIKFQSSNEQCNTPTTAAVQRLDDPSYYSLKRQEMDRELSNDPRTLKSKPLPFANQQPLKAPFLTEKRVLKFMGYFIENIKESPIESKRLRHVNLYYYLEDDTMHLEEPSISNSGLLQGQFLRREKLKNPSTGQVYTISDLYIGAILQVAGQSIQIVDCDKASRENLVQLGYEAQPNALPYPKTESNATAEIRGGDPTQNYGKKLTSMKYFMEASLGQNVQTKVNANQSTDLLRFNLVWEHEDGVSRSTYSMHFYMYDKTVEIIEDKVANSGKEDFPKLLARKKLPKNHEGEIYNDADRGVEGKSPVDYYYDVADFKIGTFLNVWGRRMQIIDCDAFTRSYYMKNYHMTEDEFQPIPVKQTPRPTYERIPPPHMGIGSEEDSLASWLHLHPKKPKRDLRKLAEFDGKVLEFAAVPLNGAGVKQGRKFSIKFYLADDTLGVYDVPIKNSGLTAGCFLRRSKFKNPLENRYYEAKDFSVGAEIEIEKHRFRLTYADEYTRSFLSGKPLEVTAADADVLTATMKFKLWQKNKSMGFLRAAFRHVDENSDGKIELSELKRYLQDSCCRGKVLSNEAAEEIFNSMDTDHDSKVDFTEFCNAFAEVSIQHVNPPVILTGKVITPDQVAPILQILAMAYKSDPKRFDTLTKRQVPGNTDELTIQVLRDGFVSINRHFNIGFNATSIQTVLEYLYPGGKGTITSTELYQLLLKCK